MIDLSERTVVQWYVRRSWIFNWNVFSLRRIVSNCWALNESERDVRRLNSDQSLKFKLLRERWFLIRIVSLELRLISNSDCESFSPSVRVERSLDGWVIQKKSSEFVAISSCESTRQSQVCETCELSVSLRSSSRNSRKWQLISCGYIDSPALT